MMKPLLCTKLEKMLMHERANMISSARLEDKAIEIAKNMLGSGVDIETISKCTEIPALS